MFQFNTVEEALEDLKKGKLILVTDDEDRENEGDLICAGRICNNGKRQFYGNTCQRSDLYADGRRNYKKIADTADGQQQHR